MTHSCCAKLCGAAVRWGPHKPLWAALSNRPPLSYSEWLAASKDQQHSSSSSSGRLISIPSAQDIGTSSSSSRQRRSNGGVGAASLLIPVHRALFALSGHHSVYGRGLVGRGIEKACRRCEGKQRPHLPRVSSFYRVLLNVAAERMIQHSTELLAASQQHSASRAARGGGGGGRFASGVWISRGRGLGNGYGNKVGRQGSHSAHRPVCTQHSMPLTAVHCVCSRSDGAV